MQIKYNKLNELKELKDSLIITDLSECGNYIALGELNFYKQVLLFKIARDLGLKDFLIKDFKDKTLSQLVKPTEILYKESAIIEIYVYLYNFLNPKIQGFINYREEDKKAKKLLLKEAK